MNNDKMKNVVILKELPSNIVKEAYVFLKPNVKIKQKVENLGEGIKEKYPDYIVKEAESVITSYLSKMEKNNSSIRNVELDKIKKKYIKLKKFCIGMAVIFVLNLLISLVR